MIALAIGAAAVACRGEDRPVQSRDNSRGARGASHQDPKQPPYRVHEVATAGSVSGVVSVHGDVPPDSIVPVTVDPAVCGSQAAVSQLQHSGHAVGGVLVWLDDARSGKPLPLERRYSLTHDRCQLDPQLHAAVTGGTLNVNNSDRAAHITRFLAAGTESTLALVHETDEGQTVPVQKVLAEPGTVEVRCDTHPWTRGWIRVFDQPYFTETDRAGAFSIDSIPPGRYTLVAWHPRLGRRSEPITVPAGGSAKVEILF